MKGFNFAHWAPFELPPSPESTRNSPPPPRRGLYAPPEADQSLVNLAATGANWIALFVRGGQETIASTTIFRDSPATASDEELRRMIGLAHALGLRVMLKPHVHLSQDPTRWHGQIGTAFTTEEQWQAWFAAYQQFIIHYATLAQDAGADMFLIGQEMLGTVRREADWRRIAQEVRQVYKGPIIYEATTIADPSFSEELWVDWWDAVDYIGVLGYFPLTQSNNPTVEDLKSAWVARGYLARLEVLAQKFQKPIIISEIGYQSKDGTNIQPAASRIEAPLDLQEQADSYQAALEVLWDKPWLAGIFWWQWFAETKTGGPNDTSMTPYGKPAEEVLKRFYLSQSSTPTVPAPPPLTPTQTRPLPPLDAFMKGIHFDDWKPFDAPGYGLYPPLLTEQSLINLAGTGANWISITIVVGQETISSTKIFRNSPATATDAELLRVINLAHSLGIRVMLFPSLILSNDPDHWWGQIGTAFTSEDQWQNWFASYTETINHYAAFAQEAGADMLSIARELGGITHRENEWRRVIQEVRQRFKGPITYSSLNTASWGFPHSEENRITWWDAVDYIGLSAYYQLTAKNDPTVAEIRAAWTDKGHIALLENLSKRFDKPIIFTEIGYVSKDGANKVPGNFKINTPTDLQEQADCYQAAMEVLWGKPWLKGIFWWQWSATSTPWPENPQGKPAEEVLKKFYLAAEKPK